jgi:hypothetical protein
LGGAEESDEELLRVRVGEQLGEAADPGAQVAGDVPGVR